MIEKRELPEIERPERSGTAAEEKLRGMLFDARDDGYRRFHARLIPNVAPETIIGVRTPALRKIAKEFAKQPEAGAFLQCLPHGYYEENNVHGFLIEMCRDYDETIAMLADFLPYVDNWATCDLISPKVFGKHLPELLAQIRVWIGSAQPYTVRFGLEMLMRYYLSDETFREEYLTLAASVRSDEYYVNMMIAWFFATALARQYDATLPFLQERRLERWTHNKAIRKAIESYRVSAEQKAYLRTLQIK